MNLRNKVQLIGHIGNAPEMKTTENGKTLAKFSVATNESYYDSKGAQVINTQWHNIVAWGKTADIAQSLLDKGKEVLVEGKLNTREYENNEGRKQRVTEIIALSLMVFGKK